MKSLIPLTPKMLVSRPHNAMVSLLHDPSLTLSLTLLQCRPSSRPHPITFIPVSAATTIRYSFSLLVSRLQFPNIREAIKDPRLLLSMASDQNTTGPVPRTPLFLEDSTPPGSCTRVLKKFAPRDKA